MDIFFLTAFVAPVVALLERNHRLSHRFPGPAAGSSIDRDLDRVAHDLAALGPQAGRHPKTRRRPAARRSTTRGRETTVRDSLPTDARSGSCAAPC